MIIRYLCFSHSGFEKEKKKLLILRDYQQAPHSTKWGSFFGHKDVFFFEKARVIVMHIETVLSRETSKSDLEA